MKTMDDSKNEGEDIETVNLDTEILERSKLNSKQDENPREGKRSWWMISHIS